MSALSGGEQSRLRLCMLMDEKINLLILDEPTNHLDVASREWIEEAVESYEGNLLFVSHDRYFINRFATRIWMLENGQIIDFRGTFEEYRAAQERKRLQAALPVKAEPEKPKKEKPRRPGGTKELEKQVAAAERAVAKAEARQYALTSRPRRWPPTIWSCRRSMTSRRPWRRRSPRFTRSGRRWRPSWRRPEGEPEKEELLPSL